MAEIVLPHNLEAERMVIGGVFVDAALWREVSGLLVRDDFFSERHRRLFDAMGRVAKRDEGIDFITVKDEVKKVGALEAVGGAAYIASLVDGVPRITNIADWCAILKDHAARRRLIVEGHKIAQAAQDGEIDPEDILARARAAMDGVQKGRGTKLRPLWEGVRGAVEELDRFDSGDFSDRVSTGIHKLDRRLRGGLAAGKLYLVCAPSGGGKTTLALQVVRTASESGPVLLVSPEMSLESLVTREIVTMSRCEEWDRNPWVREPARHYSAQELHTRAANRILNEKRPIMVLDDSTATMDEIEAAAESMPGLSLVMIDYAQQVAGSSGKKQRYLEVGEVAERSVALALRLKIPVAVASQVNVETDKATGAKEYRTRESAILEQKADTTIIIETNYKKSDESQAYAVREIESAWIVCKKQRAGAIFRLRVNYRPEIYLIEDYEEPRYQTYAGAALPPPVPGD